MANKMSDELKVSIVYRIYPKVSKTPPVHSKDKYKLSELCLSSFVKSLEGIDFKVWILLDACPPRILLTIQKISW